MGPLAVAFALSTAEAAPSTRDLAIAAVDLEFHRSGRSALPDDLAARFQILCDAGWSPACTRATWVISGVPDLDTASAIMEPACASGDPVACTVIGWALSEADVATDEDLKLAARHFKASCDAKVAPACLAWSQALFHGRGVEASVPSAVTRLQEGCRNGWAASCGAVGALQEAGAPGIPLSLPNATRTFQQACDKGHLPSCMDWARITGTAWTTDVAWEYYGGLCDLGSADACTTLANGVQGGQWQAGAADPLSILQRGCSLQTGKACAAAARMASVRAERDDTAVASWVSRGCALGDLTSCAMEVDATLAAGRPIDEIAFERSCRLGQHVEACAALGLALLGDSEGRRDARLARSMLTDACPEGEPSGVGCDALATIYRDGVGVQRDRTLAVRYYDRACNEGVATACWNRGTLLLEGVGVKRDDVAALGDLEAACQGGLARGCMDAAALLERGTADIAKDVGRASRLYTAACQGGDAMGCLGAGRILETTAQPDFAAARTAYAAAIAAGNVESHRHLARLLWEGLGGKRDKGAAREHTANACQAGDLLSCKGPAAL